MTRKKTVLIIDDDMEANDLLQSYLKKSGYFVVVAQNGDDGLRALFSKCIDIVLLELNVGATDGLDLLKQIRMSKEINRIPVPVIIVSSKNDEIDKVLCLEIGADDYILKPYGVRELLARIKAVLRRSEIVGQSYGEIITLGDLEVNESKRVVTKNSNIVDMTLKEYELLKLLIKNPGVVYTREELLETIWGYDYVGETRTVDVHIRQIRKKIEKDDSNPEYIKTVRGTGYKMREA